MSLNWSFDCTKELKLSFNFSFTRTNSNRIFKYKGKPQIDLKWEIDENR